MPTDEALKKTSPSRILIADDDESFRTLLMDCLKKLGFECEGASNGKQAQSLAALENFDAIISDIRMPDLTGIELLHWVKRNIKVPVILITGFAELEQTQEAEEMGANGFLSKPFKREDLIEVLKQVIDFPDTSVEENLDHDFCKLSIDDFVSGSQIRYTIYIRLSPSKYVKIAHQGEDLPADRIKLYKSKKINFLYMKKDDFKKYVGFNVKLAQVVSQSNQISRQKKLNFMKHTGEVVIGSLFLEGVSQDSFDSAKTMVETAVSVVADNPDAFSLLQMLQNHGDYLYAHSVGVSMYSVLLCQQMKWRSPVTLFKASMGGIFHDIGKKEIDPEILKKPRNLLTSDEVRLLETHPTRGADILGLVPSMSSDIMQIVLQHHENAAGLGYPLHLKGKKIHPIARLISVADEFCYLTLPPEGINPLAPHDAITRLLTMSAELLDQEALTALMSLFQYTPSKDLELKKKRFGT